MPTPAQCITPTPKSAPRPAPTPIWPPTATGESPPACCMRSAACGAVCMQRRRSAGMPRRAAGSWLAAARTAVSESARAADPPAACTARARALSQSCAWPAAPPASTRSRQGGCFGLEDGGCCAMLRLPVPAWPGAPHTPLPRCTCCPAGRHSCHDQAVQVHHLGRACGPGLLCKHFKQLHRPLRTHANCLRGRTIPPGLPGQLPQPRCGARRCSLWNTPDGSEASLDSAHARQLG